MRAPGVAYEFDPDVVTAPDADPPLYGISGDDAGRIAIDQAYED